LTRWFSEVEEAELRRLVYRAFALRERPRPDRLYRRAVEAIETWQVETAPDRLRRHNAKSRRS
jgi:hypothetical protein